MAHTHEYDCIICGAHFDSSEEVAKHSEEVHLKNATGMERPRQRSPEDDEDRETRER